MFIQHMIKQSFTNLSFTNMIAILIFVFLAVYNYKKKYLIATFMKGKCSIAENE